jgi:orotate phosphoribosyltransferase-like protein
MTNYREVLRLRSLGLNNSQITASMKISRQTVITALQRASAQGLDYESASTLTDYEIADLLFPKGSDK